MKLSKVILVLVVVLFVAATFVPAPVAAAPTQQFDLCEWIKRVQAGQVSWATWNPYTRTITITDVIAFDDAEAAALYQTVKSLKFKTDFDLDNHKIWQAPSDWNGCGGDAGGSELPRAQGPFSGSAYPMQIATFLAISGLIGIGIWGLGRRRRTEA